MNELKTEETIEVVLETEENEAVFEIAPKYFLKQQTKEDNYGKTA
jgi:hypothetical protein